MLLENVSLLFPEVRFMSQRYCTKHLCVSHEFLQSPKVPIKCIRSTKWISLTQPFLSLANWYSQLPSFLGLKQDNLWLFIMPGSLHRFLRRQKVTFTKIFPFNTAMDKRILQFYFGWINRWGGQPAFLCLPLWTTIVKQHCPLVGKLKK